MITLITGVPGSGKSAYVVSELMALQSRNIIVDGIPDLLVPHEQAQDVATWHEWAPEGALIVLDECQKHFRPRAAGTKVPDNVAAFETHRHRGLDFWLITQHPNLLDPNVRRLVGKHIHIRATPLGRYLYEWPQVSDPDSKADRDISAKRKFKLPKQAFSQYKSAEIHTKQKFRLPTAAVLMLVCVGIGSLLAWRSWEAIGGKIHPEKANSAVAQHTAQPGAAGPMDSASMRPYAEADFLPRNFNRPETAPVYDDLRKVVQMPTIAACVASSSKCTCYTQQGTRITGMTDQYCRQQAETPEFNPYATMPNQGYIPPQPAQSAPAPIPQVTSDV